MKYIINSIVIVILFAVTFISFSACKKTEAPVVVEDTTEFIADFEYTGDLYIHNQIQFKSNFKEPKELTWNFGDLTERKEVGTGLIHTYTQPGTYTVHMSSSDGFGGLASKIITIKNGIKRVEGSYRWNHILYRVKNGFPNGIPNTSFERNYSLTIVDDSTLQIPDIPELPYRGPYTVKLTKFTDTKMEMVSSNGKEEFGYNLKTHSGFIEIKHVRNDTTWRISAGASIIK